MTLGGLRLCMTIGGGGFHLLSIKRGGLPRRFAPRNDGWGGETQIVTPSAHDDIPHCHAEA
jgi:hypothetical protein